MDTLDKARDYEERYGRRISAEERPVYHLTAKVGWLNDPNGFSFYNGKYHLFYQYNPYSTSWDSMHWGHWTSKDLVHWDYEKAALAPDRDYETGCFSGSAITDKEGRHLLIYTAHNEHGKGEELFREETQCLAFGDGESYEKYEANPILTVKDMPEGAYKGDFRDPKIWFEDGKYYCVIAARLKNGLGAVLRYESEDILHWRYKDTIRANDGSWGRMWECPDYFTLDGEKVLSVSVMNMKKNEDCYRNGNCVMAFVGDSEKAQPLDVGFDYYAPQSMETADGRRIVIGWMQAPDSGSCIPEEQKWFGQMSFPREMTLKNGHIYQQPIREIKALYTGTVETSVTSPDNAELEGIAGRCVDMTAETKDASYFEMKFAVKDDISISISYDKKTGYLILDRSSSGRSAAICDYRKVRIGAYDDLKLRLLLDRYSFEIFINDGEHVLSGTLYETPQDAEGMTFSSDGKINIKLNTIE